MKQTAVEWLIDKLTKQPIQDINDECWFGTIGEAKQMEKEQLAHAFYQDRITADSEIGKPHNWEFEEYYSKTYGGQK